VVQEFMLAREILVMYGELGFWWDVHRPWQSKHTDLHRYGGKGAYHAWRGLPSSREARRLVTQRQQLFSWYMRRNGDESKEQPAVRLNHLITRFSGLGCTDVRDKVYALLGLVACHPGTPLAADYTVTKEELYCRVLAHVRMSGGIKARLEWQKFKATLQTALEVVKEDEFIRIKRLYDAIDGDTRRWKDARVRRQPKGHADDPKDVLSALPGCDGTEKEKPEHERQSVFVDLWITFPHSRGTVTREPGSHL
jgi:hypothetical protein